MGITRDDMIRRKAFPCSCGKLPIWVKPSPRSIILGCPSHPACGGTLAKGANMVEAIEEWNREEVGKHDTDGKRH
jgi:hypothetical protein